MLLLSIIAREFRSAARKKRTHMLRLLVGGAIATCVLYFAAHNLSRQIEAPGHAAYYAILWPLLFGLAILAPAIASSSIAEERRERTLGLLFLTRLRPLHIVMAKFASHLAELSWFVLLAIPFLAFPIWLGGIGPDEIISDTCDVINITIFGTAAGVCASSFFRKSFAALVCAIAFPSLSDLIFEHVPNLSVILGLYGLSYSFSPDLLTYPGDILSQAGTPGLLTSAFVRLAIVVVATFALLGIAAWRVAALSRIGEDASDLKWPRNMGRLISVGNWSLLVASGLWFFFFRHWRFFDRWLPSIWTEWWCFLCAFIACFVVVIFTSLSTSREKDENTLESLVSTPLSNRALVNRGIASAARRCWGVIAFFTAPILYAMITEDRDSLGISIPLALWLFLLPFFAVSIGAFFSAYCRSSTRAAVVSTVTMSMACAYSFVCIIDYIVYEFIPHAKWMVLFVVPLLIVSLVLYFILLKNFRRFAARQ